MKSFGLACVCLVSVAAGLTVNAQGGQRGGTPPAPPASTSAEVLGMYTNIANFITRTAAMVPEDKMTWAPTPDVRSYARMFAHITDAWLVRRAEQGDPDRLAR